MDSSRVARVREDMERADARRLQPHYIESFFLEAFPPTRQQRSPRGPPRGLSVYCGGVAGSSK